MSSGRKQRILISCVTFEVSKIVEPAIHYEATKVHLIHYGNEGVYREFYDEVVSQIKNELPRTQIIEHGEDQVFDFNRMMNAIMKIIRSEQNSDDDADIYINVSAGTSEYSSAALIASMMMDDITAFTISAREFSVPMDRIREIYYENGRPVGMAKTCNVPRKLSTYTIERPDEKQVLALGILRDRMAMKEPTAASYMIPALDKAGIMEYTSDDGRKPDQKSTMYYQRNFIDRWLNNGWVERTSKRGMKITEKGINILDVFLETYRIS